MKNVCILFSGGAYGTFLEWCLNYFTDPNFDESLPFNTNGNSHKFVGNHLYNIDRCREYVDSDESHPFIRLHPRYKQDELIVDNFRFMYENFKLVIHLHCTKDSMIWQMNNKFEKLFDEGWLIAHRDMFEPNLKNWSKDKTFDNIANWELREYLSYLLYDQHASESDLSNIDLFKTLFPNIMFVSLESLRDDFENVIQLIASRLDLPIVRNNFVEVWEDWIKCQYHCFKDRLINDIVDAVINNKDMEWDQLTLVDEAMVQYFLRKNGYNLKCYNLNVFPTNSIDLKKISYELT